MLRRSRSVAIAWYARPAQPTRARGRRKCGCTRYAGDAAPHANSSEPPRRRPLSWPRLQVREPLRKEQPSDVVEEEVRRSTFERRLVDQDDDRCVCLWQVDRDTAVDG